MTTFADLKMILASMPAPGAGRPVAKSAGRVTKQVVRDKDGKIDAIVETREGAAPVRKRVIRNADGAIDRIEEQ